VKEINNSLSNVDKIFKNKPKILNKVYLDESLLNKLNQSRYDSVN